MTDAAHATTPIIAVHDVSKTFGERRALDAVTIEVGRGEMVALIGPSGSGKSTLLRTITGLAPIDRPAGSIHVLGHAVQREGALAPGVRHVRARVAFIFQQFNLVGRLPLLTNVLAGLLGRAPSWRTVFKLFTRRERLAAMAALDRVGMAEYARQRASTLSGGQQQRGAIARAMVQRARVILADEPIASLDPASSRLVMQALADLNRKDGVTVVVSLHQIDYARHFCPRSIALNDGRVVFDGPSEELTLERLRAIYGADAQAAAQLLPLETTAGELHAFSHA